MPNLLTLAMFPVLVWVYVRLARGEEREVARGVPRESATLGGAREPGSRGYASGRGGWSDARTEAGMRARDVMTTEVVTVDLDTSVREIARLLLARRISAVPVVVADGRLAGIVSEGDLVRRPELGTEARPSWWRMLLAGSEVSSRSVRSRSSAGGDLVEGVRKLLELAAAPLRQMHAEIAGGHTSRAGEEAMHRTENEGAAGDERRAEPEDSDDAEHEEIQRRVAIDARYGVALRIYDADVGVAGVRVVERWGEPHPVVASTRVGQELLGRRLGVINSERRALERHAGEATVTAEMDAASRRRIEHDTR